MAQARPNFSGKTGQTPSFYARSSPTPKKKAGKRLPLNKWLEKKKKVFNRDSGCCQSPLCQAQGLGDWTLPYKDSQCDHILPISKGGSNIFSNLRTLCVICHGLRRDESHRGLTRELLERGLLPENWMDFLW